MSVRLLPNVVVVAIRYSPYAICYLPYICLILSRSHFPRCGKLTKNKTANDNDVAIVAVVLLLLTTMSSHWLSFDFLFLSTYLFAKFNFNISADNNFFAFQ